MTKIQKNKVTKMKWTEHKVLDQVKIIDFQLWPDLTNVQCLGHCILDGNLFEIKVKTNFAFSEIMQCLALQLLPSMVSF